MTLRNKTCYLKTLQRSLEMHESKNGLFLIHIQDLCQCHSEPTSSAVTFTCEAAFKSRVFARSKSIACDRNPKTSSDCHHAVPCRPSSTSEGSGRRDHGKPSFVVDGAHESIRRTTTEPGSVHGVHQSNDNVGWGSPKSTCPDRRADSADATTAHDGQSRKEPRAPNVQGPRFRRRVGTCFSPQQRVPEMVTTRNQTSQNRSTVQPARMDPPMPSTPPRTQRHASTTPTVPAPTSHAGNPGAPSNLTETQIVLANTSLESWGNKRVSWGKKHLQAKYSDVYEGDYQYLQWLEARARTHTHTCNDGLHRLLPDQGEHGATRSSTWLSERSLCVNHWEEIEWLLTVDGTHRKSFLEGITLLEVYAETNSRLSEMVIKLGGKAERFTKEDGDLSTVEGQRKLLQLIHRIKPEHIWMAPECGPWGSWSRFNANRSLVGYHKVQKSREESIKHLKLCNVVMKTQVSESRHFHLENPLHSELWNQKEIQDILVNTRIILFDQCRFRSSSSRNSRTSQERHQASSQRHCAWNLG